MDLDDLKQMWEDQDKKLDTLLRLNPGRLHASALGKAETAMKRLTWMLWAELLLDFGAVLWLGSFLAERWSEPPFLVPALVLHLSTIGLLALGVRQLVAIRQLDFGGPIVTLQKRMESLRVERLRAMQLTLLAAPLLWTPLLIVILKGLLGVDAYRIFSANWLAANLLFGLAVIPLAIWIARRSADRMERSPLAQRLLRDLAGYNLNAASGFLSRVARFEEEEQTA
jgi:serine/threonine-protein kinase